MIAPGLIIAAPRSGSGKTTVALGLMRALARRGAAVQPYKCGPDYIDPAFHAAAAGRASYTLDSWAMDHARIAAALARADGADLAVAEGSMGLFDGVAARGASGNGANADMAALTGWTVVLVMDVSGQAQSAAATALGCQALRPDMTLAGAILNRIASPRHEALTRAGFAAAGVPVLGALPRRDELTLPERHLGLVQAGEIEALEARLEALADFVEEHLDIPALAALAAARAPNLPEARHAAPPPGQRIALAQDAAFSFVYPHLMADWRAQGAEIAPFSPLADAPPDASADAVWLPGGYPELHAARIAANTGLRADLQQHLEARRPLWAECGGMVALCEAVQLPDGTVQPLWGLLPGQATLHKRLAGLGPQQLALAGQVLRGHTFHYSTLASSAPVIARSSRPGEAPAPDAGEALYRSGSLHASYFHAWFASSPRAVAYLLGGEGA
jgi:cobyrinic acid a,c-diamide synthase